MSDLESTGGWTPGRRAGFVAVLGWTNVGKSTLLNRLLRQKVVITSPRAQTTRYATSVILTEERGQVVFVDTPGFHHPRHLLNELMLREANATLTNADAALHVVSPDVTGHEGELRALLERFRKPRILTLNKIDLLSKDRLAERLAVYADDPLYDDVVPISAGTGENVDRLLEVVLRHLPEGGPLFPVDDVSDRNERFFMAEIIREKVILHTRQEIPYASAVLVDSSKWDPEENRWRIDATIYVEKDSQKGIVIGAGASLLKTIGQSARRELETFLQARVHLQLWVKVKRHWTRDARFLEEIGYRPPG